MASGHSLSTASFVEPSTSNDNGKLLAATPIHVDAQLSGPAAGLTFNDLRQVFSCSRQVAAATLGITVTCLKRVCHELNIERWPYRKLTALQQLQLSVLNDRELDLEQRGAMLRVLQEEVNAVMQNPNHNVVNLNAVRQRMYRQRAQQRKRTYGEASSPEGPHGDNEEDASGHLVSIEEHSRDTGNAGANSTGFANPGATGSAVQQQPARRGRRGHAVQDWLQAHTVSDPGLQLNPAAAQLSSLVIGTAGVQEASYAAEQSSPARSLGGCSAQRGTFTAATAGPTTWDSAELLGAPLQAAAGSNSGPHTYSAVKDLDQVDSHPCVPAPSSARKAPAAEDPSAQRSIWQLASGMRGRQGSSSGLPASPQSNQAVSFGMQHFNNSSKQGQIGAGTLFLDSATSTQVQPPAPIAKHTEISTTAASGTAPAGQAASLSRIAPHVIPAQQRGVVEDPLEQARIKYLQERALERARHREALTQAGSKPPGTVPALYL